MPTQLLYRRYWSRVKAEWGRRRPGVMAQWELRGPSGETSFIDYHLNVPGTVPEKMVYSVLENRNVDFYFSYYFGDIPFTTNVEAYRPDFIIPQLNIIIEVWGIYWHSQPGKYYQDAQRAYLLRAAGWRVVTITDAEIMNDPYGAVDRAVPELRTYSGGGKSFTGYRPFDPTASLRAQRQKWPKVMQARWKVGPAGSRAGVAKKWKAGAGAPTGVTTALSSMWTSNTWDPETVKIFEEYGREWRDYMRRLGKVAPHDPYYVRWKDWWDRFGRLT